MTSGNQRGLSFAEDQSTVNDADKFKRSQQQGGGGPSAGGPQPIENRRKSVWNTDQMASRKSMVSRRLSHSMSHSSRKSSQDQLYPRVKLQNTYRTEPEESARFQPYKIEPKLYSVLEDMLDGKKYDSKKATIQAKDLSQDILRETRNCMNFSNRYKLVAHVFIGEMKGKLSNLIIKVAFRETFLLF